MFQSRVVYEFSDSMFMQMYMKNMENLNQDN